MGDTVFLVKWKGRPSNEADWEPVENIPDWRRLNRELDELDQENDDNNDGAGSEDAATSAGQDALDTPPTLPKATRRGLDLTSDDDDRLVESAKKRAKTHSSQSARTNTDNINTTRKNQEGVDQAERYGGIVTGPVSDPMDATQDLAFTDQAANGASTNDVVYDVENRSDNQEVQRGEDHRVADVAGGNSDNDENMEGTPGEEVDANRLDQLNIATPDNQIINTQAAAQQTPGMPTKRLHWCDDPAATRLGVSNHSNEDTICSHPRHFGGRTTTCSSCLDAAVRQLDDSQRDAHEHGAFFKICLHCTEVHLDWVGVDEILWARLGASVDITIAAADVWRSRRECWPKPRQWKWRMV